MLACARIGAVHSVVFGGFAAERARDPHRRRQAEGDPVGELRHRARPHRQVQAAARRGDRARAAQARRLPHPAAPAGARRRWSPAATTTGPRRATRRSCLRATRCTIACRSPPPIRSTSSTPRARPAARRAWCATTAATWSRSNGRCRTSTASSRARCTGRPPTSAGWSATATSSTRRCSTAAPRSSTRASRSARPTPARSGA